MYQPQSDRCQCGALDGALVPNLAGQDVMAVAVHVPTNRNLCLRLPSTSSAHPPTTCYPSARLHSFPHPSFQFYII
jgi:hypothetical protein